MRAIYAFSIAVLIFSTLLPGQRRGRNQAPAKLENFTFAEKRFDSQAVEQKMPYGLFLPKGYDDDANKDKEWPVVIWLHGMWEDHRRFYSRGGATALDKAVSDGILPPCIFVTANGGRTTMYVNREDERWEDLISKDLVKHIDEEYRASKDRDQRAIMGISMGGMAALRIALRQPDLFGAVGAHSSAVFAADPKDLPPRLKQFAKQLGLDEVFGDPIKKEPWQRANPVCIAERCDPKDLASLRIYFDAGSEDRYSFHKGNELLHKALDKKGIEHTWRLIEGGGHSWRDGVQRRALPHSLAFVGAMFRGEKSPKSGK